MSLVLVLESLEWIIERESSAGICFCFHGFLVSLGNVSHDFIVSCLVFLVMPIIKKVIIMALPDRVVTIFLRIRYAIKGVQVIKAT